jgi:acyl dehydratase
MAMNLKAVGVPSEPSERTWSTTDAILYALGVGAGQADVTKELEFTTENSADIKLATLPTFANMLTMAARPIRPGAAQERPDWGDFHRSQLLHGEQAFEIHNPIPAAGTSVNTGGVIGIYDKGSGALVVTESKSTDKESGIPLATVRTSLFVRGEGGFGGDPGPSTQVAPPERVPDEVVTYAIPQDQALLYRLSGDRNPLHSDPSFAARGGFPRPILHGMCTYGYVGRALLHTVCESDPTRFLSMSSRFSKPVMPGSTISVSIWAGDGEAFFSASTDNGDTVLDRGRMTFSH